MPSRGLKGGTARTVKIGHEAARSLDRYLRARARRSYDRIMDDST